MKAKYPKECPILKVVSNFTSAPGTNHGSILEMVGLDSAGFLKCYAPESNNPSWLRLYSLDEIVGITPMAEEMLAAAKAGTL